MLLHARERRSKRFNTTGMMEEFARETQRAVSRGNLALAKQHLEFLASRLRRGNPIDREYIDVYYVESILYGVTDEVAKQLWSLLPASLKQLYRGMWGMPKFK